MSKVKLNFANKKFLYLYSTGVENMFINEFMPAAPGDYVKVYLYGLMLVQNGMDLDLKEMRHSLGLTKDEAYHAWTYWCKLGIVKLNCDDEKREIKAIEFINLPEYYYGRRLGVGIETEKKASKAVAPELKDLELKLTEEQDFDSDEIELKKVEQSVAEFEQAEAQRKHAEADKDRMARIINEVIKDLYNQYEEETGRTISKKEIQKIAEAVKVFNIAPDVMSYAIKYCAELEKYSIDYIFTVAKRWTEEGCRDISQVKEQLDKYSKRNANYATVFREMGFTRLPNPSDKAMMDKWFDEMGCSIAEVIDACRASAGLREPTLKYVNKVLENRLLEAGGIDTRAKAVNSPVRTGVKTSANLDASNSNSEEYQAKVSNKVLKEYYEFLRNESERTQNAHIDELCSSMSQMRDLFEKENKLNAEMLSGQLLKISREERDAVRAQRRALEEEKKTLLLENGYQVDYLDRKYKCDICGDTGTTDEGRNCVCARARAEEAYKWYQTIKKN